MANYTFSNLCTPAKILLIINILSLFGMFFAPSFTILAFLYHVIVTIVLIYFINWLCSVGWSSVGWFLVALNFLFLLLFIFGIMLIGYTVYNGVENSQTLPPNFQH